MAIIKKYSPFLNLSNFQTFITDENPNSDYFNITEFKETFSGGKNGFLIAGSPALRETTEIKIEVLDVNGDPVYFEPGSGYPEYYEGTSTLVSVHVYEDTPIGIGKITILGELKEYWTEETGTIPIPKEWRDVYNVKWEKVFKMNKLILNEDIVRFYKRPLVRIEEIVKPLFTVTTPIITQTGSLVGIPQLPDEGTDLNNWTAGTLYLLRTTDDSRFSASIDENVIDIPSLNYSPTVKEVLNEKELLVEVPYSVDNIVQSFPTASYTSSFEYIEGQDLTASELNGSFAKIQIAQLKTFVGDVARVKIFRKSRNEAGDFQLTQDTKLESTELLRDLDTQDATEISYGKLTDYNLATYWETSSVDHPVSFNVDKLQNSMFINYDTGSGGIQKIETVDFIPIASDVEYSVEFKTRFLGTTADTKQVRVYLSSSDYTQDFTTIESGDEYQVRTNISENIIASTTTDAKLVFEVTGDDWYISDISLRNAQDTSFSPDEFVLVQSIPRELPQETFDFKFEFYDINNNYIPVEVNASKIFNGGNLTAQGGGPFVILSSNRSSFRFLSGSFGNPEYQQTDFTIQKNEVTGSTTWTSGAYDQDGVLLITGDYPGGGYPGFLTDVTDTSATLLIENFTGSESSISVSSITYTASIEGVEDYETIFRYEDGNDVNTLLATSDRNQFYYNATDNNLEPSGQVATFKIQRVNLDSDLTPIEANSGSAFPALTVISDTQGIITYELDAIGYSLSDGESTYSFTGSDAFGTPHSAAILITPVVNASGSVGSGGQDSKAVKLTSPYYVITYDKNGENPTPSGTLFITASDQNFSSPLFKFTGDGISDDATYLAPDTKEYTIPTNYFTTADQLRVGVADGNQIELAFDTINIFAVRPGDDGSSTEFYYIKPKNGTQIKNNSGSIELQAMWSSGSDLTELSSGDYELYDSNGILSVGGGVTAGANGVTYNPILDQDAILGSTVISLKSGSDTFDTVTLVDVTDGLAAGSIIANNLFTRRPPSSSVYTPEFLYLTASFYGSEGNNYLEYVTIDPFYSSSQELDYMSWSLDLNNPQITVEVNDGDGGTIPENVHSATKDMNIIFTFTDPTQIGSITTAQETFYIISDGQDGVDSMTVFLTNEAHTYPANSNAHVDSGDVSDGSFEVRVFEGVDKFTTGSGVDTYSILNLVEVGITGSFITNIDQAKYTPSEVNDGINSGTVTFDVRNNTTLVDYEKTYSWSKSIAGTDGFGSTFYLIKPLDGTQIKNSIGTLEIQAYSISGSDLTDLTSGTVQLYSGSVLLNTGMTGVTAGSNGVTYNAIFDKDAIDGSLTISLKDGSTVVDTITLVDVGDGQPSGTVLANNLFTRRDSGSAVYAPTTLSVTASFYNSSGTEYTEEVLLTPRFNGGLDQWKYSVTTDNPNISIVANDGDGVDMVDDVYINTKDINTLFTFVDPIAGGTITAQETFYIISDGADGGVGASGSAGDDGLDGQDGYGVTLSSDYTIVSYNSAGSSPSPSGTFNIEALDSGFTVPLYKFTGDGVTDDISYTAGNTKIFTVPSSYFTTPMQVRVGVSDNDQVELVSTIISIGSVKAGDDGTPGGDGDNGLQTANGMVHYALSVGSAPTGPDDGTTTYTFSSGIMTGMNANWQMGAPTYASGNTEKYWYANFNSEENVAGGGISTNANNTFGSVTQAIGFSGLVSFTAANDISDDGGNELTFGVAGATLINGDNISTGKIISTNFDDTINDGTYINVGSVFDCDNGAIRSENFYIDSTGTAGFKGTVTIGATDLDATNTLNENTTKTQVGLSNVDNDSTNTIQTGTTSTDVGLGSVQNLNAQNQAQSGLISGTTITGGGITLSGGGNIKGGQTAYNTGTGFFLGWSSGYKFSIGVAGGNGLTWDGSTLAVKGTITVGTRTLVDSPLLNDTATNADVGLGNVDNQSASTIQSGTTADNVGLGNVENADPLQQSTLGMSSGVELNSGGIILGISSSLKTDNYSITNQEGIFLGSDDIGGYDFFVGNSTNNMFWDNSSGSLSIKGTIAADAGNIGDWSILEDGTLRSIESGSGDNRFILDANVPEMRMYSGSTGDLEKTVAISAIDTLSDPTTATVTMSTVPTSLTKGSNPNSPSGNIFITETESANSGFSGTATLQPGSYDFILDSSTLDGPTSTNSDIGTIAGNTIDGKTYDPGPPPTPAGGFDPPDFGKILRDIITQTYFKMTLYLQLYTSAGVFVTSAVARQYEKTGNVDRMNWAVLDIVEPYPGDWYNTWDGTDNGGSSTYSPSSVSLSVNSADSYKVKWALSFEYKSGDKSDCTWDNTNRTVDYGAVTIVQWNPGTVGWTNLPNDFVLSIPSSITEINNGGIQVLSSLDNYVRMERNKDFTSSSNLLFCKGGNIASDGDVIAAYTSDIRLKDDIIPITNAISKINAITGVQFTWNEKIGEYREGKTEYGLIAQDVEKVLPYAVTDRDTGYKALQYDNVIALLVQGIKEQQIQIDELKQNIIELKKNR